MAALQTRILSLLRRFGSRLPAQYSCCAQLIVMPLEQLEESPASWFMHWFVTMWMLRFGLPPICATSFMALMRCAGYFGSDHLVALEYSMLSARYNKL